MYFDGQIDSDWVSQWEPLQTSVTFNMSPPLFEHLPMRCSRFISQYPCPSSGIPVLQEAVSFDVENDNWNPNLGINCVVILDITVLRPFWQIARKQYMWMCAYIFMCIHFCIYVLKNELLWISHFLFSTTGFFLALPFLYNLQWEIWVQLSLIYYLFNQSLACDQCLNTCVHLHGWTRPLMSASAYRFLNPVTRPKDGRKNKTTFTM